jgi:hypothetical protein
MHGEVLTYNSGTGVLTVDINHHTGSGTYAAWTVNVGGVVPQASVAWGSITGTLGSQTDLANALNAKLDSTTAASTYFTIASAAGKANLSGATFTGKVNLATISASSPSVNLGGQCDSAPASATNGDLWISNAASPKLTYRTGGINYNLAVLNQFNTFTGQMVINTTSSGTAALRVTQLGAGNAIEVEDSTSPDSTRFVVDANGKVGIGVAPDAAAALKVDANGIMFFNGSRQLVAPENPNLIWLAQNYLGTITSFSYDYGTDQTTVNHSSGVVDAITAGINPMSGVYLQLVDYNDPYGFSSNAVTYGSGYIVFSGDLNSKNLFPRIMPSQYFLPGAEKSFYP